MGKVSYEFKVEANGVLCSWPWGSLY